MTGLLMAPRGRQQGGRLDDGVADSSGRSSAGRKAWRVHRRNPGELRKNTIGYGTNSTGRNRLSGRE